MLLVSLTDGYGNVTKLWSMGFQQKMMTEVLGDAPKG